LRSSWPVAIVALSSATSVVALAVPVRGADLASYTAEVNAAEKAMMANPEAALVRVRGALRELSPGPSLARARGEWLEGEALARMNKADVAAPIIDRALGFVATRSPRSKLHADLLMSRAGIAGINGALGSALGDLILAHSIFQSLGEARSQAIALLAIGDLYASARDYPRALRYYEQSAEAYSGDPALLLAMHNNRGNAFKELHQYDPAITEYQQALAQARALRSAMLGVNIVGNLASAQFLAGHLAAADATAVAGLRQAASLPPAGLQPPLWGVRAQIAFAHGDVATAAQLIEQTFAGVDLAATTMDFRDFHAAAERIFAARGDTTRALAHLRALKRLDDGAGAIVASANSALMGARFDFANQDLRIARLKSGQLQRDVELARQRERIQRVTLWSVLGIAAAIIVAVSIALRSLRRSRNRVRAANDGLTVSNAALGKALKARTEFLATTSHEIRTPLNGILGMTQVILCDPGIDAAQRERVAVVQGAAETMRALVDDILDVAKIETGAVTADRAPMELLPILREVSQLWRGQAEQKGLAFAVDLVDCPDRIVGDTRHLRQILFNLLSNAVKFTEAGSICLLVRSKSRDLGEALVMSVIDSGIGIAVEEHDAIFQSFHQVDSSTNRKYGGTGLGLAICRALARASGGEVAVASEVGIGSTFTVTLPLERPTLASAAAVEPGSAVSAIPDELRHCAVLVADANPLKRSFVEVLLTDVVDTLGIVADATELAVEIERRSWHHIVIDRRVAGEDEDGLAVLATAIARTSPRATVTVLTTLPYNGPPSPAEIADWRVEPTPVEPFGFLTVLQAAHAARTREGERRLAEPASARLEAA